MSRTPDAILSPDVAAALAAGHAVVALESTLLAHGLPRPDNRAAAGQVEDAVRAGGAVPATIAVLDGVPHVGLSAAQLDRVCAEPGLAKLGVRDLPVAAALGISGATTVSSTALLAAHAGIGVFATGGLGGVHRGDTFDESADLAALARTSILPGFYVTDSGYPVDWSVDDPAQAAAVFAARRGIAPGAVVLAHPVPADQQLDPALHDRMITEALAAADSGGVRGKHVTPFLLDHLHRASGGATLAVNVRLVLGNAELAGRVAAALAGR